jgi:hypothetical protein
VRSDDGTGRGGTSFGRRQSSYCGAQITLPRLIANARRVCSDVGGPDLWAGNQARLLA